MMVDQRERLEEFVKVCKEKGLKITPQRLAVYEILLRREDHPTVEEIYEEVKEIYPFVSLLPCIERWKLWRSWVL